MKLVVNDEAHIHNGDGSIKSLISELNADKGRVAVMVNGDVVPRTMWDSIALNENDRIELLVFAGGG